MRYIPLYWCLGLLLLAAACRQEEQLQLNFFTVETGPVRSLSGQVLGKIEVNGTIVPGAENTDLPPMERYGFIWANSFADLENNQDTSMQVWTGSTLDFVDSTRFLKPNQTYYYQAFAQSEARFMRGAIRRTTLSIETNLTILGRENDRLLLQAAISGLGANTIPRFGLMVSAADSNFTVETAEWVVDTTNLNAPTVLRAELDGLAFNTTYYVRTFFETNERCTSAAQSIRSTDGWQRLADLPPGAPTTNVAALVDGDRGLLFGGTVQTEIHSTQRLIYELAPGQTTGEWERRTMPVGLTRASVVQWEGNTLVGGGAQATEPFSWFTLDPFGELFTCDGQSFPQFYDGVAFVLDGKFYFGSGRIVTEEDRIYSDQFWEVSGDLSDCVNLRQVASLPFRIGSSEGEGGRSSAITFQLNGEQYVGSGRYNQGLLQDLYRFVPPATMDEQGSWVYVGELPGVPRQEAIAFTLGDYAYYGTGSNFERGYQKDFYRFDGNSWEAIEPFPGLNRSEAFSFTLGEQAYLGGGRRTFIQNEVEINEAYLQDFWTYIPAQDD